MPSFSNIFNNIRGNRRVGVLQATTSPLAETTPIGSVIPQGVALTNIEARAISPAVAVAEAVTEREEVAEREEITVEGERIPPQITQISFDQFINDLWLLVQDDIGYQRYNTTPNFTRFRRAFQSQDGRENLYDAFLNSPFAIIGVELEDYALPDDGNRISLFYQRYRGRID
jgi:hypothetical protein